MEQYTLKKPSSHKRRKRIGCGNSSGHGKTSGKGHKGQKARSGVSLRPAFEGGQMPIHRRIPKRGFTNNFRTEYQIVNLNQLGKITAAEITVDVLKKSGLIKKTDLLVKIIGNGNVTKAFTVSADSFSDAAKAKIEKAGGKAVIRACAANN